MVIILASLEMVLRPMSECRITNQKASVFQGILMEYLEKDYASQLHTNELHPYSQYICSKNEKIVWRINTLNEEAYQNVLLPLMSTEITSLYSERDELTYQVVDKNLKTTSRQKLIEEYYFGECDRYVKINFSTPTAFKSEGRYLFWPQIDKIYRSLVNKYDIFSSNETLYEEETLAQLIQNTEIIRYNIRSTMFHLEGVKIPSFLGNVTVKIRGPQPLVNLANMLWRYSEYSGIGIKTAIGMGASKIIERRDYVDKKAN